MQNSSEKHSQLQILTKRVFNLLQYEGKKPPKITSERNKKSNFASAALKTPASSYGAAQRVPERISALFQLRLAGTSHSTEAL